VLPNIVTFIYTLAKLKKLLGQNEKRQSRHQALAMLTARSSLHPLVVCNVSFYYQLVFQAQNSFVRQEKTPELHNHGLQMTFLTAG
jgi:hypothetical protein